MTPSRTARRWLWNAFPALTPSRRRARLLFYRQFVTPGDLCLDIGANRGGMTELLLMLGARVVAVEPQRACVDALERAFGGMAEVDVVATAVGASPGKAKMMIGDADSLSSLSQTFVDHLRRSSTHSWTTAETVGVTTLDALIDAFGLPDFVRLDIEGYEPEALSGLSRPIRCLSFEFLPGLLDHAVTCVATLERLTPTEFNYSTNEESGFDAPGWITGDAVLRQLAGAAKGGHVYARPRV